MRTFLLLLVACCLAPSVVIAQSNCSDGTFYDDGIGQYETGYGFNEVNVARGAYGMKFDAPFYPAKLDSVCLCWIRQGGDSLINFNLNVWDGSSGTPGALLGRVTALQASAVGTALSGTFYRYEIGGAGIEINGPVFIGPDWNAQSDVDFFLCVDTGVAPARPSYLCGTGTDAQCVPNLNLLLGDPLFEDLGIRAKFVAPAPPPPPPPDPDPPAGPWLTTSALSGYQFKVRINGSAVGTQVVDCVPETLCVAGAIPTRTELFLRIIGPRPNGFLWAQLVRFTTSRLEVWIQRLAGGQINYYNLPAVPTDSAELPGLVDKEAYTP